MMRGPLLYILFLTMPLAACCQSDVIDIHVVKNLITITPDTPYLIDGEVYKFSVHTSPAVKEVLIEINKGFVKLQDSVLTIRPLYSKNKRSTAADTALITFRLRDARQADIGTIRRRYLVYNKFAKPLMPAGNGNYQFWGDWNFTSSSGRFDTLSYTQKVLTHLDSAFTYSDVAWRDGREQKVSSITMTLLTHYHKYHVSGNKLSAEMIKAVRDEKNGCEFTLELYRGKGEIDYSRIPFDTRPMMKNTVGIKTVKK